MNFIKKNCIYIFLVLLIIFNVYNKSKENYSNNNKKKIQMLKKNNQIKLRRDEVYMLGQSMREKKFLESNFGSNNNDNNDNSDNSDNSDNDKLF